MSKPRDALVYRGWLLVDLKGGRYATKNGRYLRVCPLRVAHTEAMERFHERVDAAEGLA